MAHGRSVTAPEKVQIIEAAINKAERYLAALKAMQNGSSERRACIEHNVSVSNLRNFMLRSFKDGQAVKTIHETYVPWQEQLFMTLMQCKLEEVPPTAEQSIERALRETPLSEHERTVISQRFMKLETLEEVGKTFNATRERVRQIEAKAIRKLKTCLRKAINNGN